MTYVFQILVLSIFICHKAFFSKAYDEFYTDFKQKHTFEDFRSQNIDQNKELYASKHRSNNTTIPANLIFGRKWQVGRVSRKQYEIVNMLWRKTKSLVDFDGTTIPNIALDKITSTIDGTFTLNSQEPCQYKVRNQTPSYIEFYYLDEFDDQIQRQNSALNKTKKKITNPNNFKNKISNTSKTGILRHPILSFLVHNQNNKQPIRDSVNFDFDDKHQKTFSKPHLNFNKNGVSQKIERGYYTNQPQTLVNLSDIFSNKVRSRNDDNKSQWLSIYFNDPIKQLNRPNLSKAEIPLKSTTIYDKIKFFEIYDNNTVPPKKANQKTFRKKERQEGYKNLKEKTFLIQANETHPFLYLDNRTKATKTIINYSYLYNMLYIEKKTEANLNSARRIVNKKRNVMNNSSKHFHIHLEENKRQNKLNYRNITKKEWPKVWPKYPYVSVYIYEPFSIYCDAAAINKYWLIASGSCLSRHHKNTVANGRSAYIAYCGDNWWQPESIAYVRRSLIHPEYNHRYKSRRHFYNIGLVQVVTSMINRCSGWAPVSLVSHKFTITEKGFPATAIGWGLDRYRSRHPFFNLPRRPLVAYEGTILSKSCYGNTDFRNEKYGDEIAVKNLYCLSLPYEGEKNYTTHGSLLLVEGKLMALYLQGKGQASGTSAQYTGLWRLIPWIYDLAHKSSTSTSESKE